MCSFNRKKNTIIQVVKRRKNNSIQYTTISKSRWFATKFFLSYYLKYSLCSPIHKSFEKSDILYNVPVGAGYCNSPGSLCPSAPLLPQKYLHCISFKLKCLLQIPHNRICNITWSNVLIWDLHCVIKYPFYFTILIFSFMADKKATFML